MATRRRTRRPSPLVAIVILVFFAIFCSGDQQQLQDTEGSSTINLQVDESNVSDGQPVSLEAAGLTKKEQLNTDNKLTKEGNDEIDGAKGTGASVPSILLEGSDREHRESMLQESNELPVDAAASIPVIDTVSKNATNGVDGSARNSEAIDDSKPPSTTFTHTQGTLGADHSQSQTANADKKAAAESNITKEELTTEWSVTDLDHVTSSDMGNYTTDSHSSEVGGPDEKDQTFTDLGLDSQEHVQPSQENHTTPNPGKTTHEQLDDPDYLDLDKPTREMPLNADNKNSQQQSTVMQTTSRVETAVELQLTKEDGREEEEENEKEHGSETPIEKKANEQETNSVTISQQNETTADTLMATEEKGTPKEGSLASFLEKVKNQELDLSVQLHDDNMPSKTPEPLSRPKDPNKAAEKKRLSGTWGIFTSNKRYADLEILGLLFDKQLVANASHIYNKVFEPVDDLVIPTLYSKILTGTGEETTDEDTDANESSSRIGMESLTDQRSVNTEFVEGLDDLDKFFEGVDPPDELDVGAAGTSIQDVLMGQTSKIIIKRVSLGTQWVSRMFKGAKTRVSEYLAEEDRRLPELKKEHFVNARDWVVARRKDVFDFFRDLFESIFNEGEEFMDYANDLQKKLQDLTSSKEPLTRSEGEA